LASGASGYDNSAKLWDVETGEEIATLVNTTGYAIRSVAFSPDGEFLAAGIDNGTVKLWNLKTFGAKTLTGDLMSNTVNDVSFSSDGKTLVFGSQTAVVIWDIDAAIAMWGTTEGKKLDSVPALSRWQ